MAEALAAAFTDNLLTCSICLGEYEDPRVLPCYHTFCFGCISDHATRTTNQDGIFQCPLCREEINFPREGLVKLKKDFRVHKTKELLSQRQEQGVSSPNKETDVHDVTQAIARMTISCEKHPNKELEYYCEDDDTVICGKCIATQHSGHRITSVQQVAKCNRNKIKVGLVKTMKTLNRFKEAVAMGTVSESRDSQIRAATIENIQKQSQRMRNLIDQREAILISELNSAYDVRKKQNEANKDILDFHHASLHNACDFAQELIANGTDSDVMVHTKPLIERLAAMEKTPVPTPDTPAQISYSPGEISAAGLEAMLGQVTVQSQLPLAGQRTNPRSTPHRPVFSEKAECVHSFSAVLRDNKGRMFITGLTIDEQYTYVVDSYICLEIGNDRTKMYKHNGEFKFDIKVSSPFDVAVSKTGQLYITSQGDKCVQVYTTRGQHLTTIGQNQLQAPCGITMNKEGHVMVCDRGENAIFTFHADSRQLLNTIPLDMCECPENITLNTMNDNIVISERWGNCVHVLSPTGEQLYQYGTRESDDGQLWGPRGVCTDSYGHIFIADMDNHRIVALSPQGQFIRYIATKDDGLKHPVALAINPAGQLVVAEVDGQIKSFQYLQ